MKGLAIMSLGVEPAVAACLPSAILRQVGLRSQGAPLEELRLRRGRFSTLCRGGETVELGVTLSQGEMDSIVHALCGGSMYAHEETVRQGYLSVRGGVRVGVCGHLRLDGGRVLGVSEVSSLVFRFPRAIPVATDTVCRLLTVTHPGRGVLIYSPPGVGKTTLLRGLIPVLAAPPYRMVPAVVDTRQELCACGTDSAGGAEWLFGYPRALGIEIATRTLSPRLIVCDEIGDPAEAEAICAACNAGVPLLATAHGSDPAGLLRRRGLRMLHESGVFGSYVGLSRTAGGGVCQRVTAARELCGCG